MTVSELKAILPQLQSLRFHTVSDEGVIVYTRSYAALYNMVSVNALDNEFGAREIYRKKLDSLFASLSRRYGNLQGIGLRAEAVDAMLHILNDTGCIVGRQKRDLCFELFDELTADEIRYYILIYDAIQQSAVNAPGSRKYLNDIAGLLEEQRMPKSSVEALFCRSIAIDNLCDQISNEAQRRMWANVK